MPDAVVGLFDAALERQVTSFWSERVAGFGMTDVSQRVPWPHISFHVADGYDADAVIGGIGGLATHFHAPIAIAADGWTVFTGETPMHPVVVRLVARSPRLSELHELVVDRVAPMATGPSPHHEARFWTPHITLASRDVRPEAVGALLEELVRHPVPAWRGHVARLGLIRDDSGTHQLTADVALG